ncbi:hypothetical protein ACFY64_13740 [Streptomyces collinus]|uniref:hypothetical protein n=1 Tax=Streptomyces collinus TaxID=42684 RepID=UPI0036883DFA
MTAVAVAHSSDIVGRTRGRAWLWASGPAGGFDQTLLRQATKPVANEFGEAELRDWYRELDLLPGGIETVIGADSTLRETVDRIMLDTGLAGLPALDL